MPVHREELVTHFIDGKSVESMTGERRDNVNPWTREVESEVALGAEADVQAPRKSRR